MNDHFEYPRCAPYASGFYDAGDGHKLYYQRHGNPNGEKVVYLHGGPGGGCTFNEYRMFCPDHFDVLLFDQRGAGKSLPYAATHSNSPAHLVDDLEKMRKHFGIEKWSVCGGSWGSAYAQLYATAHPESIKRMLLRGISFADQDGADYINEPGGSIAQINNAYFQQYLDFIPNHDVNEKYASAYNNVMSSQDHSAALEAAKRFVLWDSSVAYFDWPAAELQDIENDPESIYALARIWFHYCAHHFKDENRDLMLSGMSKLNIPVHIIHGMQDYLCDVQNAKDLYDVCRNGSLHIFDKCGHVQAEPALRRAFQQITEDWKTSDLKE